MGSKQAMQQELTGSDEGRQGHRHVTMARKGGGIRSMRAPVMAPSSRVSSQEELPPKDPHQPS